jgi:signal transduction histidine kinase
MVKWMRERWGLRAKMASSYVLVTAAAVAVVEAVVLVLVVPGLLDSRDPRTALVAVSAHDLAASAGQVSARLGRLPDAGQFPVGDTGLRLPPGQAQATPDGAGVRIPYTPTAQHDGAAMSMALLADPQGRIVSSSYPARYPPGGEIGGPRVGPLPGGIIAKLRASQKGYTGQSTVSGAEVLWAVVPVYPTPPGTHSTGTENVDLAGPLGAVYVQIPAAAKLPAPASQRPGIWTNLSAQLGIGLLVLLGALPVGAVFGLLSTRRLLGRLRHLAASTAAVAGGDYQRRVAVCGGDEVAQLEAGFNQMAERLADTMATERALAGANERARIARELHDSISQDLFSLRLLAGGLRRTLPAGSPLYPRVEAMEHTVSGTLHEMQALLLELRPVALRDAGLLPALDELCRTYRDRLGIAVEADLEPIELDPAAEPAVLRVMQEALANAVKHARPSRVVLRARDVGSGRVVLSVSDDGAGFDPAQAARRHGMGLDLMRERVAELGGALQLESTPGEGTTVRITLGPTP